MVINLQISVNMLHDKYPHIDHPLKLQLHQNFLREVPILKKNDDKH